MHVQDPTTALRERKNILGRYANSSSADDRLAKGSVLQNIRAFVTHLHAFREQLKQSPDAYVGIKKFTSASER